MPPGIILIAPTAAATVFRPSESGFIRRGQPTEHAFLLFFHLFLGSLVELLGVGLFPADDPFLEANLDVVGLQAESTNLMGLQDLGNVLTSLEQLRAQYVNQDDLDHNLVLYLRDLKSCKIFEPFLLSRLLVKFLLPLFGLNPFAH